MLNVINIKIKPKPFVRAEVSASPLRVSSPEVFFPSALPSMSYFASAPQPVESAELHGATWQFSHIQLAPLATVPDGH